MQINSLGHWLKKVGVKPHHQEALPAQKQTAKPEQTKVVSNPVREPVNRQAARVLAPNRCWLSEPPKEFPPKPVDAARFEELKAQLKTERNEHAITRAQLGEARAKIKDKQAQIELFARECNEMRERIKQQAEIIRQLEDIKL